MISSRGGGLDRQMRLAEEYAFAESIENPPKRKEEKINAVDSSGHLSQITLAGQLKPASPPSSPKESENAMSGDGKVEDEIQILREANYELNAQLEQSEKQHDSDLRQWALRESELKARAKRNSSRNEEQRSAPTEKEEVRRRSSKSEKQDAQPAVEIGNLLSN